MISLDGARRVRIILPTFSFEEEAELKNSERVPSLRTFVKKGWKKRLVFRCEGSHPVTRNSSLPLCMQQKREEEELGREIVCARAEARMLIKRALIASALLPGGNY